MATDLNWKFERGDVIQDRATDWHYRISRRLVDYDTSVQSYEVVQIVDNGPLTYPVKLVENPKCFKLVPPTDETK
jgi:hypothetical protein